VEEFVKLERSTKLNVDALFDNYYDIEEACRYSIDHYFRTVKP